MLPLTVWTFYLHSLPSWPSEDVFRSFRPRVAFRHQDLPKKGHIAEDWRPHDPGWHNDVIFRNVGRITPTPPSAKPVSSASTTIHMTKHREEKQQRRQSKQQIAFRLWLMENNSSWQPNWRCWSKFATGEIPDIFRTRTHHSNYFFKFCTKPNGRVVGCCCEFSRSVTCFLETAPWTVYRVGLYMLCMSATAGGGKWYYRNRVHFKPTKTIYVGLY